MMQSSTTFTEETPLSTSSPGFEILDGGATDSGIKFEHKMAALVMLRALRRGFAFSIYRNVAAAKPFDDIVVKISVGGAPCLVMAQLKHGEERGTSIGLQVFCQKKREDGKPEKGDFNLRKYFQLFERSYDVCEGRGEPPTEDEEKLWKIPRDRQYFILYTNKVVKMSNTSFKYEQRKDVVREVLEELFSTNPIRSTFTFNQSVDAVWNLLHNEDQEKLYQEEFLPRLIVFDNQSHADDLDLCLRTEIEATIGKLSQDTMKIILHNLYEEMEPWIKVQPPWTEKVEKVNPKKGKIEKTTLVHPLSEDCHLLEKAVAMELRRRAREVVGDDLRFQDKHCEVLSGAICAVNHQRTHSRIRLLVEGVRPGLRAAKVVQVLESNTSIQNTWIYVNDKILKLFTFAAIKSTCYASDVIVVDMDSTSSHQSQIKGLIDEIKDTKTILEFTEPSKSTNEDGVKTVSDDWTLNQLEENSQKVFLERRVNFQGVNLALGDLEDAWSTLRQDVGGAALDILATEQELALGVPPAAHDQYFIQRSVQHRTELNQTILEVQTAKDCFVLKGFPDKKLRKLRAPHSNWQECDSSWKPSIQELSFRSETFNNLMKSFKRKYTQWTIYGKDINVKERASRNTHWVTYSRGHIWWEKSIGDSKVVIKHIRRKSAKCTDSPECIHADEMDFLLWSDKNIILTDIAGMGKTTFFKQIAKVTKDNYPTQWVYFVDLTDIDILKKIPNYVKKDHMVDLIREIVNTDYNKYDSRPLTAENAFFRHCLETSGNITVFVDGVDEVCPKYKLKALGVLEVFREVLKHSGGKMWVAARTVLEEDLANTLCSPTSLSLIPFTRDDQVKYLLSCWKEALPGKKQEKTEKSVIALVNDLRKSSAASGDRYANSLCDVPLYIRMFADSYTDTQITQLLKEDTVTFGSKIDRISLFHGFVEKLLRMNLEKSSAKKVGIDSIVEKYVEDVKRKFMLLAVRECFEDEKLPNTFMNKIKEVEIDLLSMNTDGGNLNAHAKSTPSSPDAKFISHYGIANFNESGKISFIHYTIAEYLAAHWLHEHYISQDEQKLQHHLTESLYTREFGECRTFFDELFVGKCLLHKAALTGHRAALEEALAGVNMEKEETQSGRRALHFAAIGDNVQGVVRLLEAGTNARAQDSVLCWTPARYADALMRVQYKNGVADNVSHMEVIEKLLDQPGSKSSDIPRLLKSKVFIKYAVKMDYLNIIKKVTKKRFLAPSRPLIKNYEMVRLANHHESSRVLRLLKDRGFKFNKIDKSGEVTLHEAAREGYKNMCTLLLEKGNDVKSYNNGEETPLHLAAAKGYTDICQLLLNAGANANLQNESFCTALHLAAGEAHKHIRKRLEIEGMTDPSVAEEKHLKLCTLLVDNGANIDARDKNGNSVLHFAAFNGCEEACRLFINKGLPVDIRDKNRVNSLHWAVINNKKAVCKLLIERGADVNAKDCDNYFPLHWAAMGGREEICKLLILRGADVNCTNVDKDTPLHKAAEHGYKSFCEILLHSGANIHVKNFKGNSALQLAAKANLETVCQLLIEKGANVNEKDYKGRCSLHIVAKRGFETLCELLIQHGANIDARMINKCTALHMASKADCASVCSLLVKLGADINAKEGVMLRTPLHVAAERSKQNTFHTLLENGADFYLKDIKGYTVLHIIAEKGYVELLKSLLIYFRAHRIKWDGPLDKKIDDNSIELSTGKRMTFHGESLEQGATAYIEWEKLNPCMEACTFEGLSALHLAARAGRFGICKLLIQYGININIRDQKNKRAIHYANENGHTQLREFLERNGAIVNEV